MINEEEKKYWLAFSAFPGIGPLRFKLLRDYFGSAQKAWWASDAKLMQIGLGEKLTAKFIYFRGKFSIDEYVQQLQEKKIQFLTLFDKSYPKLLKEITGAPFVLYLRGNIIEDWWENPLTVAVVGTRRVTNYGIAATRKIVEGLVAAGVTIVSGMAYGVDTVAHETAIAMQGKTIAVLGSGIDQIHPITNTRLYWNIVKKSGAVVSEFSPGLSVSKGLFPSRNRIISGLSLGVVVTEGARDSGALITASFAAEQGREVFAVPGPITSDLSAAPTFLLKHGAKMVTDVEDILEELHIHIRPMSQIRPIEEKKDITADEIKILEILTNENLHFDEIMRRSKMASSRVGSLLTMMEMKKLVKNTGNGVYQISSSS